MFLAKVPNLCNSSTTCKMVPASRVYDQMRIHVKHPAQFLAHSKPWIFTDISLIFNIIIHSPLAAPPSFLHTSPLLLSPAPLPNCQACFQRVS